MRARSWQDEAKEAITTSTLLTEAPLEDVLEAKREAEEAQRIKASLSKAAAKASADPFEID